MTTTHHCQDCARIEVMPGDGSLAIPGRRCAGCKKPFVRGANFRARSGYAGSFCCVACHDRHFTPKPAPAAR